MTMCGLTLLPRKVLPTIFLVLMSMNAISLLSRFTIITTDVGSATLTVAAWRRGPNVATPAARTRAPSPAGTIRFVLDIIDSLEARLDTNRRNQESVIGFARHALELMLKVKGETQLLRELEVVVTLDHPLGKFPEDPGGVRPVGPGFRITKAPVVQRVEHGGLLHLEAGAPEGVPGAEVRFGGSPAAEQPERVGQALIEADADAVAVPCRGVVVPEPQPVVADREAGNVRQVVGFCERVQRLRQVRRVGVALLKARLEGKPVLRVEYADDTGAVGREAEHRVV